MSFTARISSINARKIAVDKELDLHEFKKQVRMTAGFKQWEVTSKVRLIKQFISKKYHNYFLVGDEVEVKAIMAAHCVSDDFCFRTMNF